MKTVPRRTTHLAPFSHCYKTHLFFSAVSVAAAAAFAVVAACVPVCCACVPVAAVFAAVLLLVFGSTVEKPSLAAFDLPKCQEQFDK